MPEQELSFGAIESAPDYRDIPFEIVAGSTELPKKHIEDLSALPIWHQKKIGSCVGQTAGKYAQYLNFLETKKIEAISPRYLYTLAKSRDGLAGEGTYPRLMAKILKDDGAATDKIVPTDNSLDHETFVYNRKESNLPAGATQDARPYRIGGYAFVDFTNRDSLKRAIIEGHGVMISVHLGKEWYTAKNGRRSWKAKDILPLRKPASVISGHAIFLYGYEDIADDDTLFHFRNSWSEAWGNKGDGTFTWKEYGAQIKSAITFVDIPNETLETVHNLPNEKTFRFRFNNDIKAGQRGEQVTALQTALMIDGSFSRDLYAQLLKEGSLGYFKPAGVTQKALLDYQIKHKVAPMPELLALQGSLAGVKTRAMLNSHFGA